MPFNPSSTDLSFANLNFADLGFADLDLVFAEVDAANPDAAHLTAASAATVAHRTTNSTQRQRGTNLENLESHFEEAAERAAHWYRSEVSGSSERAETQLAVHRPSELPLEDTYLKFRLESDIPAAINVRSVQEAFILPARQLTTMPNMPAALLGLTNRRNQVVWVIDLAQLLGLAVFDATVQQFSLLLIQVGMIKIGLAVQRIEGMIRLSPEAIQAPIGQMSLSLLPYLQGCALQQQEGQQEILLLLDAEAIVQAPLMKYPFV